MSKPNWEQIRREWETTKNTLAALAEKHDVPLGTLKSRKSRDKNDDNEWIRGSPKKDATKTKKDASIKKVATPKTRGDATSESAINNEDQKKNTSSKEPKKKSRRQQRNRSGNPNPSNQFTERNSAALKHGLFSRYIPKETLEIMGMLDKSDPADLLWDQIAIQYAAIMRAQSIMFVESKEDAAKELKKLKVENTFDQEGNEIQIPVEQEYEIQFAWDRHATFMNAQSRAISEFRTSIKQFTEMAHDEDERKLKLTMMQVNIDKAQADIDKTNDDDKPIEIMISRKKRSDKDD